MIITGIVHCNRLSIPPGTMLLEGLGEFGIVITTSGIDPDTCRLVA
jgi:hypothetical protein